MLEYLKLFYYLLRPKTIFVRRISGAVGDNILLSVLLPGLRKKYPGYKIVVETPKPELFINNPYADWVTVKHFRTTKKFIKPKYVVYPETRISFIAQIMKYIGSTEYYLPELYLSEEEISKSKARFNFPYVVIAPSGKTKFSANRKEWGFNNFQKVRDSFPNIAFIQIGISSEPLLTNVTDARELSLRETAAVLKNSLFFLGLEGGFMHMNKSVGKTSVIIFGGYILPEISGYKDDLNMYTSTDCSPCFTSEEKQSPCENMKCMSSITVEAVVEAVKLKLKNTNYKETS